jgi:nitrous oxidase accessory protein NosD
MNHTQIFRVLFRSWISKRRGSMIKKIRVFFGFSGLVLVLVLSSSRPALAAVLFVDDDGVECPDAEFTIIQDAVDEANPGDSIRVCPGTYEEQISIIQKPLRIIGPLNNSAVVKPSGMTANATNGVDGTPIAAVVLVMGATNVIIRRLTIDGVNNGIAACQPTLVGIFYRNASGEIRDVAVKNMILEDKTCQSGLGIFVQKPGRLVREVMVVNSSIHDYQKNGITGNEPGTRLRATGNVVTGIGPTSGAAQNGIQIGFGATGQIDGNVVINHIWSPCVSVSECGFVAAGLLIVNTNNVSILGNTVGKNQCGICLSSPLGIDDGQVNDSQVIGNRVFDTEVFDGIALTGDNNGVRLNTITDSGRSAIFVKGANNRILRNNINEAPIGVLEATDSEGNVIVGNQFVNTPTPLQGPAGKRAEDPTEVPPVEGKPETVPFR